MPNVIAIHSVGNMDQWLAGAENRSRLFREFSSGYRLYRVPEQSKVAIIWEDADLTKLEATLGGAEAAKAKAEDTVVDPIEIFVEIPETR
jgi:hypothetical protein